MGDNTQIVCVRILRGDESQNKICSDWEEDVKKRRYYWWYTPKIKSACGGCLRYSLMAVV